MKGHILSYSATTDSGLIVGEDGDRYRFALADWREEGVPQRGFPVDFIVSGGTATEIYRGIEAQPRQFASGAATGGQRGDNDKVTAGMLAIFLGWLGVHKFYLGNTRAGVVYLLCGTVGWITLGILPAVIFIVSVIEGIIYLTKSDRDWDAQYGVSRNYPNNVQHRTGSSSPAQPQESNQEREPQFVAVQSPANAGVETSIADVAASQRSQAFAPSADTPPTSSVGSALRNQAGLIVALGGVALIVGGIFAFLVFVDPLFLRWPVVVTAGAVFFSIGWFLVASGRRLNWAVSSSHFPLTLTIFGSALAGLTVYGVSLYGVGDIHHQVGWNDLLDVNYLVVEGLLLIAALCAIVAVRWYGESRLPASEPAKQTELIGHAGRGQSTAFAYAEMIFPDSLDGLRRNFSWPMTVVGTMGACTVMMWAWALFPEPLLWWAFNLVWLTGVLAVAALTRSVSLFVVAIALFYIVVVAQLIDVQLFADDPRLLAQPALILAALIFVGGRLQTRFRSRSRYARVVDLVGLAMATGIVHVMSYRSVWKSPEVLGVDIYEIGGYWLLLAATYCIVPALLAFSLVQNVTRDLSRLPWEIIATALIGLALLLLGLGTVLTNDDYGEQSWPVPVMLLNGLLMTGVIGMVVAGYRWRRSDLVTLGITAFAVTLAARYFEYIYDMLTGELDTTVVLIVTGVILVIVGLGLELIRRRMLRVLRTEEIPVDV